jgi:protein ImuB
MLACVILPSDAPELTRRLFAVSPLVERCGTLAFLDVSGTSRLHGGTAGLFAAITSALLPDQPLGMSLASNRFTAEVAARHSRGPAAIAPGDEALFLSRLPLSVLPWSPDLARRLGPLGLETLGDFASLPSGSVERRYGREGLALHALARGQDEAGLLPERDDQPSLVAREVPGGADGLARLAPVLEEALGCLCAGLSERGLGISRLELTLILDDVLDEDMCDDECHEAPPSGHDPEPTADPPPPVGNVFVVSPAAPETRVGLLLDLLSSRLAAEPPVGPVLELSLCALETAEPAVHQNRLFGEVARDAARRAEALSRLASSLGAQALAKPRVRPAHRLEDRSVRVVESDNASRRRKQRGARRACGAAGSRDARDLSEPRDPVPPTTVLRWLQSPQELVPMTTGGQLTGFRRGRRELKLARLSPPRRLEGGWWDSPWARDEFELQTPDGGLYRICRDMTSRRWLLLAEVD